MRNKLLHLVLDYASGDLACSEVVSSVLYEINKFNIENVQTLSPGYIHMNTTSVNSFDTVSTGFITAQLVNSTRTPENTIVYSNCAPRKDSSVARANNEGEGLLLAVMKNSSNVVFAVNSGYSLSFIKENLESLYSLKVSAGGSQFRSRDNFPSVIGNYIRQEYDSILDVKLNPDDVIPDAPSSAIGYIDSFGNLKTTIRDGDEITSQIKAGQRLSITINDVTMLATASTGSFNVQEGDISFSPGSSGGDRKYWEIFQRGASAWRTYKKPKAGSIITINF